MMNTTLISAIVISFLLGLRHGIDWDHLAAITDIVGTKSSDLSQSGLSFGQSQKEALILASFYAFGHALIVIALGNAAINFALILPSWIDPIMERFVGITLLGLGVWVIYSLWRYLQGQEKFRLVSRWMLIFAAIKYFGQWLAIKFSGGNHSRALTVDKYGPKAAFFVGVLHGIGAETGTQVLLITAVGATIHSSVQAQAGHIAGIAMLLAFATGLLISNTLIAVLGSAGFLSVKNITPVYALSGGLAGAFSIIIGLFFISGQVEALPDWQSILRSNRKNFSYHYPTNIICSINHSDISKHEKYLLPH